MKLANSTPRVHRAGGFSLLEVLVTAAVITGIAGLLALVGGGAAHTVGLADSRARGWEHARTLQRQLAADFDGLPGARQDEDERPPYEWSGDPGSWSLVLAPRSRVVPGSQAGKVRYEWSRETGCVTRLGATDLDQTPPSKVVLADGVTGFSCTPVFSKSRGSGRSRPKSMPEAFRFTLQCLVTAAPNADVSAATPQRTMEFLVSVPTRYVE